MTPEVAETTFYENFVEQAGGLPETPPPAPKRRSSPYPHTIKVHLKGRADCEKFGELLGRVLRTDKKRFVYKNPTNPVTAQSFFIDKRRALPKIRDRYVSRKETILWNKITDFRNVELPPFMTFEVTFRSEKSYISFARLIKQRVSLETPSIWYPKQEVKSVRNRAWRSTFTDPNPRYPVYIISKGRADSRLTSKTLERMGVPYFIVIEPQDYGDYACLIDEAKILVAPFSNHGDGPGRARNWCWDHAIAIGAKRHWVLDDNIDGFFRLQRNRKIRVEDGGIFRVAEEFVDRFENVPVAGFNYDFFIAPKSAYSPFVLNTRIYSCLLIDNDCPHRWRGRYNEDTDLSLRVLKDGDCTIQFNEFLQGKVNTQVLGGGNTAEFYAVEGTWNKSYMLEKMHPDVAKVVWKFGRWHHHVDYRPFKENHPRHRRDLPANLPTFGFELT